MPDAKTAVFDAIERAYLLAAAHPVEGEDEATVLALTRAEIITSPGRMRHLLAVQKAAWAEVERLREAIGDALVCLTPGVAPYDTLRSAVATTPSSDSGGPS